MAKQTLGYSMTEFGSADVLKDILRGTATETGARFFSALVESLVRATNAHMAWVTEYVEGTDSLNALAVIAGHELETNRRYPLAGTPCEAVIRGASMVHHADNVQARYPDDTYLKSYKLRSYFGVPLLGVDGTVLGHMAVMDRRPMPEEPSGLAVFRIFASRAAAELQRMRAEKEQDQLRRLLQQANEAIAESEERFRDLFEQAPIAYVHEDLDSRFIRANQTALSILGITADDVMSGTYGRSLVADKPEAQERVRQALAAVRRGEKAGGIVLELRRKDNGQPVWIQWWSSPAPDGTYTRTMFIDVTEQVLMGRRNQALEAQNSYLRQELQSTAPSSFIGTSPQMQQVADDIAQVAATNTTVLILGETGTGKELAARQVHALSARADKPLIKVNCGALPASLIESELFGHEKGAFTGATKARDGRFLLADGGTIFLDEIGELPIDLQVKLLRVLQEGEIERLGSSTTQKVDVRIIAATNRNLLEAIESGEFREDLYYRLAVFPVEMPPLRARGDDIVTLATHLAEKHAERIGRRIEPLSSSDAARLRAYAWPGNVRELQNVIERAVITAVGGHLNLDRALPEIAVDAVAHHEEAPILTASEIQSLERRNITRALEASGWKVAGTDGAAAKLSMNASTLSSRIKSLGIERRR